MKIIPHRDSVMDKIHILILEDTGSDADLMEFELQEAGIPFTSQRAKTESDYVRALREFSPDLILSKYDLPQYTGTLALAEAKKICPEVPFILMADVVDGADGLVREMLARGAKEWVLKDHMERLAPAVRKVLRSKSGNGNIAEKGAS